MKRRLLPVAMLFSLWPLAFIAVSLANASQHQRQSTETVTVNRPSTTSVSAAKKPATVRLRVGKTYDCPPGTADKLHPVDQTLGKLQLDLGTTRQELHDELRQLHQLDKRYPDHTAPTQAVADEYKRLLRTARSLDAREGRLVRSYNSGVDDHNRIVDTNCNQSSG